MADQLLFRRQPEPAGRSAGSHYQGPGFDPLAFHIDAERTSGEFRVLDGTVHVFGPEVLGLLLHVLDQIRAVDPFGKTGEVLHQGRERELSSGFVSADDQRHQIGPGRVDGRGVSGTAGSNDHNISHQKPWKGGMKLFTVACWRGVSSPTAGPGAPGPPR